MVQLFHTFCFQAICSSLASLVTSTKGKIANNERKHEGTLEWVQTNEVKLALAFLLQIHMVEKTRFIKEPMCIFSNLVKGCPQSLLFITNVLSYFWNTKLLKFYLWNGGREQEIYQAVKQQMNGILLSPLGIKINPILFKFYHKKLL